MNTDLKYDIFYRMMNTEDRLEKGSLLEDEPATVATLNSNWILLTTFLACVVGIIIWVCIKFM